jgi:hypothetical protein
MFRKKKRNKPHEPNQNVASTVTTTTLRSSLSNSRSFRRGEGCWLIDGKPCLDAHRLEQLVCDDLPRMTGLSTGAGFDGLADRFYTFHSEDFDNIPSSPSKSRAELEQVVHHLMDIAAQPTLARRIPPKVVSEIHSFCGLIYELNNEHHSALQSHLRAVWVARMQTDINEDQLEASTQRVAELTSRNKNIEATEVCT